MIARTWGEWNAGRIRASLQKQGKPAKYSFRVLTRARGGSLVGKSIKRGTYGSYAEEKSQEEGARHR